MSNTASLVLNTLPDTFTRKDMKRVLLNLGYTIHYSQNLLEELELTDNIEKVRHGIYQKV